MRSGYSTTIPRRKNTTLRPVNRCHRLQHQHYRTFIIRKSCSVSGGNQKNLVYYELLKPGDSITGDWYRLQLIHLSHALREKRPEHEQRHDKVILLHDNARPHITKIVKKYLETLKWDRTRRILRILLLLITSCFEGCNTIWQVTDSLLSQKSKINSKIGSPPEMSHFFEMEFENCLKNGKK